MPADTDILIIGSGITGCAVARELSRFSDSVTVLEKEDDVAEGATKANSGIVHAGYDALPGTKKALYNIRGAKLYPGLCAELGVPYRKNGALVIALDNSDRKTVSQLKDRGIQNGVSSLEILETAEVLQLEPNINPRVVCALYVPDSAVVSPYELAFAMADDAALNGVSFRFNETVLSVSRLSDGRFSVNTQTGSYRCKALVNCAGTSGADIHNQLSSEKLTMVYRRGQYYLLDRSSKLPFDRTVFQCPSVLGKGVLVSPTVHGNLLLGPTAEDIIDPRDTATTPDGLDEIIRKASLTWPGITVRNNITNFSGIRAHLTVDDFVVGPDSSCPGYFDAIGIESPGLSSAPAIAEDLGSAVVSFLKLKKKNNLISCPLRPRSFRDMSDEEKAEAIAADPSNGNIICRCETVTEAEIRASIRRPVGARSVDAVKRRTRAGMGRCQGGFCLPRVASIISEETGIPMEKITKNGGSGFLLSGSITSLGEDKEKHDRTKS